LKTLLLAIVLVSVSAASLPSNDNSESLSCESSLQLGRQAARRAPAWKWFWTSWGVTSLVGGAALAYDVQATEDEAGTWVPAAAFFGTVAFSVLTPLIATPRAVRPPSSTAVDMECYRKGYVRRSTARNTCASLFGLVAGSATVQIVYCAVSAVLFSASYLLE